MKRDDMWRQLALQRAVPEPPDGRAWGAIVQRASKARLIRRIGFAPMKAIHGIDILEIRS